MRAVGRKSGLAVALVVTVVAGRGDVACAEERPGQRATVSASKLVGQSAPAATDVDPAAVRQAVRDAYSAPEFWWKRATQVENPDLPWLVRAVRTVGRWLAKAIDKAIEGLRWILRKLFGPLAGGSAVGSERALAVWATRVLLLALGVLILALLLRHASPVLRQWLARETLFERGSTLPEVETLPAPDRLLAEANQRLQQGNYREAVRYAFLALLAGLQDRGWLRYDPSRTNREYYRELLPRRVVADRFRSVATDFELVWYGGRAADRARAERVVAVCKQLLTQQASEAAA